ncbi:hypothetical protein CMK11_02490 [Candidatus Poribacteria bacterium]|nr:hypothetical protein [Candidatus Poribacteria bacterium]
MQESYARAISAASAVLQAAVLECEEDLPRRARDMDGVLRLLAQAVALDAHRGIIDHVSREVVRDAKAPGMTVHRRRRVSYRSLFGRMDVDSPYLYDPRTGRSSRPDRKIMGIRAGDSSNTLERALSDFGIKDSFRQAAERFEEHYGWTVERGWVRRVTQKVAREAYAWEESRLASEETAFSENLATRPGVDRMLTEQDGSMLRTGTLSATPGDETTPTRRLPRRRREEQWRETRVGLARRLDEDDAVYVARMDTYPEVTWRLFLLAVSRGLSARSETVCIGDGANGLMEEMLSQFPNASYILDRFHLAGHLHETAEEMGLDEQDRAEWVERRMEQIDRGAVKRVVRDLYSYEGCGQERAKRLAGYLHRFRDCVHYDAYRERGLPIGSGEVESAHRSIPQKRLKIPGACWHPDTINPMLTLRVIRANRHWNDFWEQNQAA